ncbi:hypothetical protein ACE5IS_02565 [Leptospira wolffii]|uniref:Uncharacterized protein n=1 Tax=Leptospira wolffii TaxID=409998 RepID=A0A2M9ZGR4_9LEPT|nr:hypothetical protein [Leptospira wolffii]EPG64511.1 hypothetical protein LEP1GSC061_3722 [Leptospira wolffii serovar Khorat str. Khorat-H2]PJZ67618.1 hypothetical protein CH371_06325 [Leptospira wolffii]TGK62627.1 hypothetical protein EHQ32_07400 [Leptospira wolffii]TGK65602.1 hypothetical protein EHQ27_18960 [Leptospira wolffii]TGK73986.1 hypothetical protein EHQ35_06365 [Leptospira wolffii]
MSKFSAFLELRVWSDLRFQLNTFGWILLPFCLALLFVWQNVQIARLNREISITSQEKEKLLKKNDDLKIGMATYTSARRIEALYRKTYHYLPITVGDRIITVTLPPERNEAEFETVQAP